MFEILVMALRTHMRFPSTKGNVTLEQLWDVPLRSKTGFDLDSIAKNINRDLKQVEEESFVETSENRKQTELSAALDIVKFVITTKLDEEKAAKSAAERRRERQKLLQILAEKQDGALSELSIEDLKKRIESLED